MHAALRTLAKHSGSRAGLLHNWGVGLFEMGSQLVELDPAAAAAAFAEAATRLQASIGFNRADVAPMNALGDVRLAQSELLAASDPVAAAAAAVAALEEGYRAALQVSRYDTDALLGTAESHAQLGKLAWRSGDADATKVHCTQSADAYAAAFAKPAAVGSFEERCNARYNFGCVCVQSGQHDRAHQLLAGLLAVGGVTREDVATDADLESVRTQPWFVQLVRS